MTVQPVNPVVEQEAKLLAMENRTSDPDIIKVYWFPNDRVVRLVELTEQVPAYPDEELYPFYFPASPKDNLPLPSAVILIRPDEFGKFKLPPKWGDWADAIEL